LSRWIVAVGRTAEYWRWYEREDSILVVSSGRRRRRLELPLLKESCEVEVEVEVEVEL